LSSSPAFFVDFLLVDGREERVFPVSIASGVAKVSQKALAISHAFAIFFSISLRVFPIFHFQFFSPTLWNSGVLVTAWKNASNHISFFSWPVIEKSKK